MAKDPVAKWLTALKRRNLSKATIRRRRLTARRLERFMEVQGRGVLDCLSEDVEEWLDGLRITPQTRSHYRSDLVSFYRWCRFHRLIAEDPMDGVEKPQLPKYLPRPTDEADLAYALEHADPKMRIILALASLAGLRASEITRLTANDIDRDVIHVRQGKGGKDRTVAISTVLACEFNRYQPPRKGPVVPTTFGQHYRTGSISAMVCNYYKSIGLEGSLHGCRHRAATQAYLGTGDIRAVQELLGHGSITTTSLYTKVTGVETRAAVEAIGLPVS